LKELVIATRNRKKLKELKRLLKGTQIKVLGLDYFSGLPKVKEDKATFKANAKKKALEISRRIDKLVIADDSGLEVPALDNRPGVNSARYAGASQDDKKNIAKLLRQMGGLRGARRKARFICVICVSKGRKVIGIVEGRVYGRITQKPKGKSGFGYDPVFIPTDFDKTFAQLGPRIKDRISHRSIALKKARAIAIKYLKRFS
jgi:XTP/dITP diphosphohydrolase